MNRHFHIDLAPSGLRMPIGADLVLHEQADPERVARDGQALGKVIEKTARQYRTTRAARQHTHINLVVLFDTYRNFLRQLREVKPALADLRDRVPRPRGQIGGGTASCPLRESQSHPAPHHITEASGRGSEETFRWLAQPVPDSAPDSPLDKTTKAATSPSDRASTLFANGLWRWSLPCLAEDRAVERIIKEKTSRYHIIENRPHSPH